MRDRHETQIEAEIKNCANLLKSFKDHQSLILQKLLYVFQPASTTLKDKFNTKLECALCGDANPRRLVRQNAAGAPAAMQDTFLL